MTRLSTLLSLAAAAALALVLFLDLRASREPPEALVARHFDAQVVDRPAPDFTVTRRDGTQLRLSELRGKVVFVNFWATWCAPCREEIPDLEKLAEALKGVPFEVVAVSNDEDWAAIDTFFQGRPTAMQVGLDRERQIGPRFGTEKLPETYVVDRGGRMRLRFISVQPWTDERIHRYLEWLATHG